MDKLKTEVKIQLTGIITRDDGQYIEFTIITPDGAMQPKRSRKLGEEIVVNITPRITAYV